MKRRIACNSHLKIISLLLIVSLTGCGTVFSKAGDDGKYWGNTYSGVQCSVQMIDASMSSGPGLTFFPLALADLIISAVADTLLLPVDLAVTPVTENVVNPCNLKSQ